MNRKQFSIPGRRSSQPKRLSTLAEPDERNIKNASDFKRSGIPRSRTASTRSSSVERDGGRISGKGGFLRSSSVERLNPDENGGKPLRARSNENLFTPKYSTKTPAGKPHKMAVSVQKTVRKDSRSLTDKAFQITELAKVHVFLTEHKILTKDQLLEVRNPTTLKMFVYVMNSLLTELFPGHSVTMSNYCDIIPFLMRKLKYPGNIARSWIVAANSPHSWPHVLGLMSWLTELLNTFSTDLKYIVEDDVMDTDRVDKLIAYNQNTYCVWDEIGSALKDEKDEPFYDDLVSDVKRTLIELLTEIQTEVKSLHELLSDADSLADRVEEEKLKCLKEELGMTTLTRNGLKVKVSDMQHISERRQIQRNTLELEIKALKHKMADIPGNELCKTEDVRKFQSEAMSLRNAIKLQDTHTTNTNSECYAVDLIIARLQGKLDEVRLQRDALLRSCTSEYIISSELHITLNYGEDNSKTVATLLTVMKDKMKNLDDITKTFSEKEKSFKIQMNEVKDKFKFCKEEYYKREAELQRLEEEKTKRKSNSALKNNLIMKQRDAKSKEEEGKWNKILNSKSTELYDLEGKFKVLCDTFEKQKTTCTEILKKMGEECVNHLRRCKENFSKLSQ